MAVGVAIGADAQPGRILIVVDPHPDDVMHQTAGVLLCQRHCRERLQKCARPVSMLRVRAPIIRTLRLSASVVITCSRPSASKRGARSLPSSIWSRLRRGEQKRDLGGAPEGSHHAG
ncbi:hypothetical protein A6W98_04000 [Rhodovulum sulfidophilum DSM 1374]|nr:hypothetical protein A6W98_04000 [Rhodovulum sulfidophilum DSM 1374]